MNQPVIPTHSLTMLTPPSRRNLALCLSSAFRTSLACAIVACAKLYGPAAIRSHITDHAFSYLTAILLVNDTTLVVEGAAHVLYATLQTLLLAILSLWLIGPARFSIATTTIVAALSAFVVALPESTHVMSKRIALGEIVLVYVGTYVNGVRTECLMHPVYVAASAGLGAIASVLALLLPFPRLGHYEVKETSKEFVQIVSDRLKLFVNAFCAENNTSGLALVSQAQSIGNTGKNLLQYIKLKQDSIPWERTTTKFTEPHLRNPLEKLYDLEIPMKGMEMALASCSSLPAQIVNEELKHSLINLTEDISLTLTQLHCPHQCNCSAAIKTEKQVLLKSLHVAFPTDQDDLPPLFFLFCMEVLKNQSVNQTVTTRPACAINGENKTNPVEASENSCKQELSTVKSIIAGLSVGISSERFVVAFKCSLALGLSVLLGLLFSRGNGYWAGLTVAASMTPWKEATFKAANVKAQGTVLGSVYGVLGCLISQKFMELRILVLIPWIIFTSFLMRSRMYGPAGGICATVGAILLLGRKNYGLPSYFAITRITEVFIGLFCSTLVELLLQPTRASTLARIQLCKSLAAIHDCIQSMVLDASSSENKSATCLELKEKKKKLREHVDELARYIEEADGELSFWFLPYPTSCYRKMLVSLCKMVELLLLATNGMEYLLHESHALGAVWKDIQEHINKDLELCKAACSSMECLEEITSIKSLARLEMEFQRKKTNDSELGKSPDADGVRVLSADAEERQKILSSFLLHAKEDMGRIHVSECERKSNVVLCLSAIGFCVGSLMKETKEIEQCVKEIIQSENPSSHVNLYEIYCKLYHLST